MKYPIPFVKMHALGNDFVALNGYADLPLPAAEWPDLAIAMCDRHTGVGADGLFVALPGSPGRAGMAFYNPDGTEDRCGNALRCLARFLHDEGLSDETCLTVDTFGGPVELCIELDGRRVAAATVDLGPPVLNPEGIPISVPQGPALNVPVSAAGREWRLNVVSTGTPHAVIVVDELPDEALFQAASPEIETHPLFPEKTSVLWTRYTGTGSAEVRIWERAVGETLGCGTGAAAIAVVGTLLGITRGPVVVRSRGGEAIAAWDGAGSVTLTGPAHNVFRGVYFG
ncbi:MAG TPA: diaminopimelate epimerase [Armatimonadota bacterium]|jgi:diaminopimelate epimerase